MKTHWLIVLTASTLSCGCVPTNFVVPTDSPPAVAPVATKNAEPARFGYTPPVTAGQITPANAHEKAQALRSEIQADLISATDVSSGPKDKE